ncbi:MAG: Cft2 family RNA processing exonuclease [Pirellulaceae bacterium]|jgi:Cft2 family RNA processing exonuclease
MESTYGDRDHTEGGDLETQFEAILNKTIRRGGNVVIPTFAVERAQELMYYISTLVHRDLILPRSFASIGTTLMTRRGRKSWTTSRR